MDTTISDPLVGRVVDERYQVVSLLARGGMATVYEAVDLRLERTIALKVMRPALAEDADFVSRFVREARSAARLSNPHVVAVHDQGTDGDLVFLVMEYVPSLNLREVLRERGHLSVQEAFDVLEPVLIALDAAHHAGIVHRDVKPENVLLAQDGRVLVADFGLARATTSATSATTQDVLIGTVAYLAPEQVERGVADPRSDVYAAGIMLYEMLTGAPPFGGETPMSVAYQHVNGVVPPPSEAMPGLPTAIDGLLAAATARDPDGRYSDAGRFLEALRATRRRIGLPAATPATATSPRSLSDTLVVPRGVAVGAAGAGAAVGAAAGKRSGAAAPPAPRSPVPSATRRRRRIRGLIVLLVILAIAATVGIVAFRAGSASYVSTPKTVLLSQDVADARISQAGLTPVIGAGAFSETVAKGRVISTDPAGGSRAKHGSNVVLTVSKGPERFAVPHLKGLSQADALSALSAANLAAGEVTKSYSDTVAKGDVVSSSPASGASLRRAAGVDLVVSKGPQPVKVPNVVGSTEAAATTTLQTAGLKVTTTAAYSESKAKGIVLSQSPVKNADASRGDTVALVISKGPPPVTVPNVIDMSVSKATSTLEAAGLAVKTSYLLSFGRPLRIVRTQSAPANSSVPKGSTVTIGYV